MFNRFADSKDVIEFLKDNDIEIDTNDVNSINFDTNDTNINTNEVNEATNEIQIEGKSNLQIIMLMIQILMLIV